MRRTDWTVDQSGLHDLLYFELVSNLWNSDNKVTSSKMERANCELAWGQRYIKVVVTSGCKAVAGMKRPWLNKEELLKQMTYRMVGQRLVPLHMLSSGCFQQGAIEVLLQV